jgi:hypothetical protein
MKKRTLIISLSIIVLIAVAIVVIVTKNHKEENNFDNMVERFESAAEEVLGEDIKKVSKTELAATITYGNGDDGDNIYYHILKTTYYEGGDPSSVTGLNTEALNVLFSTEYMDSCEEMMIQDWYGALYKKGDKAYLCWTCDPEVSYVLEYNPNTIDDSEIIKMAESAETVE